MVWTNAGLAAAKVVLELPDRLDEWQAFDVADGSANLADDEVESVDIGLGEFLDRVGDVRDDLHRRAEIVAAAFARDDVAIDAARGDVVRLMRGNAGEALIMAKIEVRFRPVVGHIDFAMLIGRHRPWIDIQIGIELADSDRIAARLEERPE